MHSWENEVLNRPQDTLPTIKITHYNCKDTIESEEIRFALIYQPDSPVFQYRIMRYSSMKV